MCYSDKSLHRLHYLNMLNVSQLMRAAAKQHFIDNCVNYSYSRRIIYKRIFQKGRIMLSNVSKAKYYKTKTLHGKEYEFK